jgi:hypothetical protein
VKCLVQYAEKTESRLVTIAQVGNIIQEGKEVRWEQEWTAC